MPRGKHPESKEEEAPSVCVCVWENTLHGENAQQVDAILPGPS